MRYLSTLIIALAPNFAAADMQLSFYGGLQTADGSTVTFDGDPVIADGSYEIDWEGRPLTAPPYYGIRATYWASDTFGYGLDFVHNKVYSTVDSRPAGFDRLEMTDGLNILTFNGYLRWASAMGDLTPYVGGGLGLSIPYVEVENSTSITANYQITGLAATWLIGASMPLTGDWSVFGEYKGTYSQNIADLETGGTFETDIVTNAFNVGISYDF